MIESDLQFENIVLDSENGQKRGCAESPYKGPDKRFSQLFRYRNMVDWTRVVID